ncbi:MAG: sensor histidine kinase [Bdellovibrionales bacterium]
MPKTIYFLGKGSVPPGWQEGLRQLGVEFDTKASAIALLPLDLKIAKIHEKVQAHRDQHPVAVLLGVGSSAQLKDIGQILADNLIDLVVDQASSPAELAETLKAAQRLLQRRQTAYQDLLKTRDHNRKLEQLGEGLEGAVRERTQTAADSKAEVEKRVTQLRELLRFMQDLAHATAPEDVLKFLRRELKVYHRVSEPILAFALSSGERRLIYFRSGQVLERRANQSWPQSLRLRRNDAADSQYLADEFGRPVNRVLAIPLIARKTGGEQLQPTLFFEHQLKDHEIDQFLHFIGDRLQVVSVALDRLLLEFDLRSATYLWEHTFDGLEDPVAIVDVDFHLMRSNRAFISHVGHQSCHLSFNKQDAACAGCPVQEALNKGEAVRGVVRRGSEMFAVHSYPILMEPGERPTTVVNHYLNVTEDLGLHERMVQTEKMAALGHLAGHIAHELNNPLTGIRSLAQLWLQQKIEPTSVKEDFSEIEKAAERSQAIIANLLQFATANDTEQVDKVDLKLIVQRTLPLLKTALSSHQVEVDLGDEQAWTRVAPQLMQQVVFNLLKNACQALSRKGQIEVQLSATGQGGKNYWQLTIRDSGVGIAAEHLETIFSPFYTTKTEGEGTGLGLSLSRSLVRRFGGDIAVSSTVGVGTEFKVLLPRES